MKGNRRAFTIVEVVIVLVIVAVLAAILIPFFSDLIAKANESAEQMNLRNLNQQLIAAEDPPDRAEEVLDYLEKGGWLEEAAFSPGEILGWNEEKGSFLLFDRSFRVLAGDEVYAPRSVWLFVASWRVAEEALASGLQFHYCYIGEGAGDGCSLRFSYGANLIARENTVISGLSVSYEGEEAGAFRIGLSFQDGEISVDMPRASLSLEGDFAAEVASLEICARELSLSGAVRCALSLRETDLAVRAEAYCREIGGDALSFVENSGSVFLLNSAVPYAGGKPVVYAGEEKWEICAADADSLAEVFRVLSLQDRTLRAEFSFQSDIALTKALAPSVSVIQPSDFALNGYAFAYDGSLRFIGAVSFSGGTLRLHAAAPTSDPAVFCAGALTMENVSLEIGNRNGIQMYGGYGISSLSSVRMECIGAEYALSAVGCSIRMEDCAVRSSGDALRLLDDGDLWMRRTELSGDACGLTLKDSQARCDGKFLITGGTDGIRAEGSSRTAVYLLAGETDDSLVKGRQNGISFGTLTGTMELTVYFTLVNGGVYGIEGSGERIAEWKVGDGASVRGGLAAYSWEESEISGDNLLLCV